MPWLTWSCSTPASPASAAATSTLVSLGASGSRSLSRLDIVCALDSAGTPSCGSDTTVRSASLTSRWCSHDVATRPPPDDTVPRDRGKTADAQAVVAGTLPDGPGDQGSGLSRPRLG